MGRAAYITKKEGRYWFQKRISGSPAGMTSHLRLSLRTTVYREAVARMVQVMWKEQQWSALPDFSSRARYIEQQLAAFNKVGVPYSVEQHIERRQIEIQANRFITESRYRDRNLLVDCPGFWPTWITFCEHSDQGEHKLQFFERRAYEVGRSHADEASAQGWHSTSTKAGGRSEPSEDVVGSQAAATAALTLGLSKMVEANPSGLPKKMLIRSADAGEKTHDVYAAEPVLRSPSATEVKIRDAEHRGQAQDIIADDGSTAAPPYRSQDWPFSLLAAQYLADRQVRKGNNSSAEDAGLVLRFFVDFLGDKPVSQYTLENYHRFENALIEVPKMLNVPREHQKSLHTRYCYAQEHGWEGLCRLSKTRLRNVWHLSLNSFLKWAVKKGHYTAVPYIFDLVGSANTAPQQRDAWTAEELVKLFSLPLFTGCRSRERFWTKGNCFVQNELYWAYLLIFFLGMRASEIAQLRLTDIKRDNGTVYVDLTEDDKSDEQRRFKTPAARRRMPIPRLLIDLGFLDRVSQLAAKGEKSLFPKWPVYEHKKGGRDMYGHHFSKSWQYIKKKFDFSRDGLTLHGGRHTRASFYDLAGFKNSMRNRLLGHAPASVAEGYGANYITNDEAAIILASENSIEKKVAEILITAKLKAEFGQLHILSML